MPKRPQYLSRRPETLELQDPRSDVLADVIGVSLLRNALYRRIEAQAPWGIAMPQLPRAMFYLVARGFALLDVAGEASIAMSAGEVVFVPHGTAHVLRDSRTSKPVHVCEGTPRDVEPRRIGGTGTPTSIIAGFFDFGGERKPALLERMPNVVLLSGHGVDPWVAATVQLILAESASPGPASALILQRLADVLFVQALRSLSKTTECQHRGLPALADPAIHRALTLVHGKIAERWTVAELASRVGLSRSSFAARFTSLVGEPPLAYLARWRIARAAELLRESDDAIATIATRVGYESVPSFSKAFKRWQGASPAAFRRTTVTTIAPRD